MKAGLVLAALLGLADVGVLFTGGEHPPRSVAVSAAVLGVVTLAAVGWAWARRSRPAVWVIIGTRTVSALAAVPSFFVAGVPAGIRVGVAVLIALTVACVALLARSPRPVRAAA